MSVFYLLVSLASWSPLSLPFQGNMLVNEALGLADVVQEAFPFEVTPESQRPVVSTRHALIDRLIGSLC